MEESGELVVIIGPMFSGKTTRLINEVKKARREGWNAVLLKPQSDTRYSTSYAVSHNGLKMRATALPEGKRSIQMLNKIASRHDFIGIDEGHFWRFVPGFEQALNRLAFQGKTIYISMLGRNNRGQALRMSRDLLPLADTIYTLSARCSKCGGRATFTQRVTSYRGRGLARYIGGLGDYEARCRRHFVHREIDKRPKAA